MTGPTIIELDERIAMMRENINELVEQAAAYSGAEDENRTADRIAEQEQELSTRLAAKGRSRGYGATGRKRPSRRAGLRVPAHRICFIVVAAGGRGATSR